MARLWWIQAPTVAAAYWLLSDEPAVEKALLVYLTVVTIVGNAIAYGAKQAGYENP